VGGKYQNSQYKGQYSNAGPPAYEVRMLIYYTATLGEKTRNGGYTSLSIN